MNLWNDKKPKSITCPSVSFALANVISIYNKKGKSNNIFFIFFCLFLSILYTLIPIVCIVYDLVMKTHFLHVSVPKLSKQKK
jgi:hypothetical protein